MARSGSRMAIARRRRAPESMAPGAVHAGVTSGRKLAPGNQQLLRMQRRAATFGMTGRAPADVPIGRPGDPLEREADEFADRLFHRAAQPEPPDVCRVCSDSSDTGGAIRRQATAGGGQGLSPGALTQGGQPLSAPVRAFFEPQLGQDLSSVRVHSGALSEQLNRDVSAAAFTYGNHIWLGRGQSADVTHTMAHELCHVGQQSGAPAMIRRDPPGVEELREALAHLERRAARPVSMLPEETAALTQERELLMQQLAEATRRRANLPARAVVTPPPTPRASLPELTPQEMVDFVLDQRHFGAGRSTIDPAAVAPMARGTAAGPGYQTNAAIQIVDRNGNQVALELAQYGGSGNPHAEAQSIGRLRLRLSGQSVAGGRMRVAVEQLACGGCLDRLRALAQELALSEFEVYVPEREGAGPKWTSRTAATAPARSSAGETSPRGYRARASLSHSESLSPTMPESAVVGPVESQPAPRARSPVTEPAPAPVREPPAPVEAPPRPPAEPTARLEPAAPRGVEPPVSEATPPGRGGGRFGGVGGVAAFAFQLGAAFFHQHAVRERIRDRANVEGVVPPNAPSRQGLLYDLGAWMMDPMNDADRAVGIEDRVNVPVWRERVRQATAAIPAGGTFKMTWFVGRCAFDILGDQLIDQRVITYRRQSDGHWSVEEGDPEGTVDLNDLISSSVSDATIRSQITMSGCGGDLA